MSFNYSINARSPNNSPVKNPPKSFLDDMMNEIEGLSDFKIKKQAKPFEAPKPEKTIPKALNTLQSHSSHQDDFISKYINNKRDHLVIEERPERSRSRSPPVSKKFTVQSIPKKSTKDLLLDDFIPLDDGFVQELEMPKTVIPVSKYRERRDFRDKTKELPIYPYKPEIVDTIAREQVTIISGDTGCGKSTQVPKYILENSLKRGLPCKIICTQPRRIAAINLAKRVRKELHDQFEDLDNMLVGYHIGMEVNYNKDTQVIFMTNGIFLQRFIHEDENTSGGILKEFTHIILDEVHERDIDSDFIMVALKHVLSRYPHFKLILMSATINAQLFAKYFSPNEIKNVIHNQFDYKKHQNNDNFSWNSDVKWEKPSQKNQQIWEETVRKNYEIKEDSRWGAPSESQMKNDPPKVETVEVNKIYEEKFIGKDVLSTIIKINSTREDKRGTTYTITNFYLGDITYKLGFKANINEGAFSKRKAAFLTECINVCVNLIDFICSSRNPYETNIRKQIAREDQNPRDRFSREQRTFLPYILIFLPGLSEIYHVIDVIAEERTLQEYELDLLPLHSTLSDINQQKLFEEPKSVKQRKIILATNIAESSITIPSVMYVIDFCLLKEINTSGRTGIESLELVWASRASIRQRAGRTGRVSDGFSFRLIPEKFYERDLDDFSKPELLRSPLDKLILRIKMLNESEKQSSKKEENYLFTNPKTILGRAIEPPQLESIGIAIQNLQDSGALTCTDGDLKYAEITFLGRVYCDLPCEVKISKLILLGLAFQTVEETITIAALLSQRKAMFKPDSNYAPRNRYMYMKTLYEAAEGTKSDHFAILKIYADWETKFISANMTARRIKKWRESYEEKKFCNERTIDPVVLREAFITKSDIKSRLIRLGILPENHDNKYFWQTKPDLASREEFIRRLKFVLTGGFYFTYMRTTEFKKESSGNNANYVKNNLKQDPIRTLAIRHTEGNLENQDTGMLEKTEKNWKMMLATFHPEQVKFMQDKAYVSFKEDNFEFPIKSLMYIKRNQADMSRHVHVYQVETKSNFREELKFRHVAPKDGDGNFFDGWMKSEWQKNFANLGDFDYYCQTEFVDYFTRKRVKIDIDSINNVVIQRKNESSMFMVTHEYHERKTGELGARYTTLIDFDCPFILPIITMLLAPQIKLKEDINKSRYKSFEIDGSEIDLNYHLTKKEIDDINRIRSMLQSFLMDQDKIKSGYIELWTEINNLLQLKRLIYIPQDKWEDDFQREWKINPPTVESGKLNKLKKKPEKKYEKFMHNYLLPIQYEELPNCKYFTSPEIMEETEKYYNMYHEWKKTKIEELTRISRLIDQTSVMLACGQCGTKFCDFKFIGEQKLGNVYRALICVYESHEVLGCYSNHALALRVKHKDFSGVSDDMLQRIFESRGIKQENGVALMNKYPTTEHLYITFYSRLKWIYPDNTEEPFDFHKFSPKEMLEKNAQKNVERKKALDTINCIVCQRWNIDEKDFKNHLRDKNHVNNLKLFMQGIKDEEED